jgi:hypothetical protein
MRPSDEIENVVKKMSFKAGPEMDKDLWAETSKARNEFQKATLAPSQHNIWRTIMKSPLTKLATAAIVAIACLIGLSLWRGTESGIAMADVLARVEQVRAYSCKWSMKITCDGAPGKPYNYEVRATDLVSREHGTKSKWEGLDPNGGESTFEEQYFLPQEKTKIRIIPKQKKYERTELDDAWAEREQKFKDPRWMVKEILGCKYESMGKSTIDGIEVEGFQTTDPNYCRNYWTGLPRQIDAKIWVDVKTWLPARTEHDIMQHIKDNKIRTHIVTHDYRWDVPVDAAEFEPVIPDDYTRIAGTVVKWPALTEETAIQGLKLCVDLLGKYPEGTHFYSYQWPAFQKSNTPVAMRLQEEVKGLTEDEKDNRLMDAMLPMRSLDRFYAGLQYDKKDPAYYGKTVTPQDADKVLLRWKVSDNEYRVIFGDLRVKTVTAEELAELEKP